MAYLILAIVDLLHWESRRANAAPLLLTNFFVDEFRVGHNSCLFTTQPSHHTLQANANHTQWFVIWWSAVGRGLGTVICKLWTLISFITAALHAACLTNVPVRTQLHWFTQSRHVRYTLHTHSGVVKHWALGLLKALARGNGSTPKRPRPKRPTIELIMQQKTKTAHVYDSSQNGPWQKRKERPISKRCFSAPYCSVFEAWTIANRTKRLKSWWAGCCVVRICCKLILYLCMNWLQTL